MPTSRLNILVAEDRPEEAAALQRLLRLEGHQVRVAADGEAALQAAIEEPPQVMLLDIDLPKLDGCSVAAAARDVNWRRRPVVVTLTGHDGDDYRRRAVDAGVDMYLTKPVDPDTLRAILGRVCVPPAAEEPADAPAPAAADGPRPQANPCTDNTSQRQTRPAPKASTLTRRLLLTAAIVLPVAVATAWWAFSGGMTAEGRRLVGTWQNVVDGGRPGSHLMLLDPDGRGRHAFSAVDRPNDGLPYRWWVRGGEVTFDFEPSGFRRALRPVGGGLGLTLRPSLRAELEWVTPDEIVIRVDQHTERWVRVHWD